MSQKINVTNQKLCDFHTQIQQLKGGIFEYWLNSKIAEFYKNNGQRLESINEAVNNLRLEFFECEEKREGENLVRPIMKEVNVAGQVDKAGNPVMTKVPTCKEGKTQEGYQEAYKELMSSETILTI